MKGRREVERGREGGGSRGEREKGEGERVARVVRESRMM